MAEKKVKVKIKPLHGIGGVGEAGDVVWMTPEDAEMYFRDGYVEYVKDEGASSAVPPSPQPSPLQGEGVEDHAIMKPQSKRGKKS